MVAKVIPTSGEPFHLLDGQGIHRTDGFSLLGQEAQEALEDIVVYGTEEGFNVSNIDGKQGEAAFEVTAEKIIFKGASKESWGAITFEENPSAIVLMDGTRIEPVIRVEKEV